MIRSEERQRLFMDFGEIGVLCSDIDMLHVFPNGKLLLGEIKNRSGYYKDSQRHLLTQIIDGYKPGGIVLYIQHDEFVENGAKRVNVAECEVVEYYTNGKWFKPNTHTTVKEVLNKMEVENMGASIEGRGKVWVKEWNGITFYNMSVGSKDQNGKWINASQNIRFKKDAHPETLISDGTVIDFKGFATVSKGNDYNKVVWQITEFTVVGNEMASPTSNDFERFTENDIPF